MPLSFDDKLKFRGFEKQAWRAGWNLKVANPDSRCRDCGKHQDVMFLCDHAASCYGCLLARKERGDL